MSTINANSIGNNPTAPTDLTIGTSTNNKLIFKTNNIAAFDLDINQSVTFYGTGFVKFPAGTTAQRPAVPVAGMYRFNTTLGVNEEYNGTTWVPAGSNPIAAITSGSIDGAAIGQTTPAAGAFTNLSATGNTTLGDASTDVVTFNGNTANVPNGLAFVGTGSITAPVGTTAQRPGTPANGMIRFNSTTLGFEGYGGNGQWGPLGAGLNPVPVSSTGPVTAGNMYACDSTAIAFSLTLPAAPVDGQMIGFHDRKGTWGTNNVTVVRNGKNIVGSATDLILNNSGATIILAYEAVSNDWYKILLARP